MSEGRAGRSCVRLRRWFRLVALLWITGLFAGSTGSVTAQLPAAKLEAGLTATPSAAGIDLAGWAVDPCGDPEVLILVDGKIVLRGEPSLRDQTVTERFRPMPGSEFPGFGARLGTENLGAGRRHVQVIVRSKKCGAEKVLLDSTYRVPPVWRRAVRAADILVAASFFAVCFLAGWLVSRLPSYETRLPRMPLWVLASGVAAAAAIVAGPQMATSPIQLRPGFFSPLANWDGGWYRLIATAGYDRLTSRAFFPLYPALLRAGRILPIPLELFGATLSLFFSWLAARLFTRLEPRRDLAVLFLFCLPYSFFFSAVYTEALFLVLAAGLLVAMKREGMLGPFALGFLASLSRAQGVFLAILTAGGLAGPRRRAALAGAAGCALGFGLWCAWLWWRVGDPLAFRTATAWFGRSNSFSLTRVLDTAADALRNGTGDAYASVVSLAVVLAASIGLLLERRWADGVFSILVPTLSLATSSTTSIARYVLGAFPAILYLGAKLKPGRGAWVVIGLLFALKLLFGWFFGRSFFMG